MGNPLSGYLQGAIYHLLDHNPEQAVERIRSAAQLNSDYEELLSAMADAADGNVDAVSRLLDELSNSQHERQLDYYVLNELLVLGMSEQWFDYPPVSKDEDSRGSTILWHAGQRLMRRDPRFIRFLNTQGITDLWREIGPPPDCRAQGDTFVCGFSGEP